MTDTPHVFDATEANFEADVLQASLDTPVLVDFWAAWCAPCRALVPKVEAVADRHAGDMRVMKIDVDQNPLIAQRYGVRAIPTLILFNRGQEVARLVGAASEAEIELRLDRQMGEATH